MTDETNPSPRSHPKREDAANSPLARVLRNSAWNALGMVLTVSLNFVAIMLLARRLGKETLGVFYAIFALAVVVHFVLESGFATALTRRIAQRPEELRRHVSEAAGLLLLVSLASVLALLIAGVVVAAWQGEPVQWAVFLLAGVAVASRQALEFAACALRGLERFEFENLSRVLQSLLFCGGAALFVERGPHALIVAQSVFAASSLAAALLLVSVLAAKWRCIGWRMSFGVLKDWLAESLPLGLGDTARRLIWQVDTILLGIWQPAAAVGLYSIAYRPLQPLQLVPRTLVSVIFPAFSRLAHRDHEALSRLFGRSLVVLWMASLPICVGTVFWAEKIIVIPAGPEYAGAVLPLQLLIWTITFAFVTTQLRFLLMALGEQRAYWRSAVTVLAAKVALGAWLIPLWGVYGACAATMAGEALLTALNLALVRRLGLRSVRWRGILLAGVAAVAMAAVLWPVRDASLPVLAVGSALAVCVYFACCLWLEVIEPQEVARVVEVSRAIAARLLRRKPLPSPPSPADFPPAERRAQPAPPGNFSVQVRQP